MNIEKLEKLLLLEINVQRLDSTGLTNIYEKAERLYNCRKSIYEKNNLTPIERIMSTILLSVQWLLADYFGEDDMPYFLDYEQEKIGNYRADFVVNYFKYSKKKYVIECDGHDFHEKTKEQAKHDKQRERFFVSQGYTVLRFSGSEIIGEFEKIKLELFELFKKDIKEARDD